MQIIKFPPFFMTGTPGEVTLLKQGILSATGGYACLYIAISEYDPPYGISNIAFLKNGNNFLNYTIRSGATERLEIEEYPGAHFNEYVSTFAAELYKHPDMARDYTVEVVSYNSGSGIGLICIKARKRGSEFNLEIDGGGTTIYLDGSVTLAKTVVDDEWPADYKVEVAVNVQAYLPNPEVKRYVLQAEGVPDYDNDRMVITIHDLPQIAKTMMGVDIPVNALVPVRYKRSQVIMDMEVWETYNGVTEKSLVQRFIAGDFPKQSEAYKLGTPLNGAPGVNLLFETWTANEGIQLNKPTGGTRIIDEQQPEWLTIYLNPGQYETSINFTYTDGYGDNTTTYAFTVAIGGWYYLPSGVQQGLKGTLDPSKQLHSYTFGLYEVGGGGGNIVYQKYIIDQRTYKRTRYFIYSGPNAMLETLRCVGVSEFSLKRKVDTTNLALTEDSRANRGTIEMVNVEHEQLMICRTGWLMNEEEKNYLQGFLLSTYAAEVVMPVLQKIAEDPVQYPEQPYRAVIIQQDSIEMWKDDQGAWGCEFKLKYAHDETNYSNYVSSLKTAYDSVFEFTVEVDELFGGTQQLSIYIDGGAYQVEINGVLQNWGPGYIDIDTTGVYHFKVSATIPGNVEIAVTGISASITMTRIETDTLTTLTLFLFQEVKGDYFIQRLRTLYTLQQIYIACGVNPGFAIDEALAALTQLYTQYNVLTTIGFDFSSPSSVGYELADMLTGNGVTVTTS